MTKENISTIDGCGIYCITNTINGKQYVGQAINLKKRLSKHYSSINRNYDSQKYLYRAIRKYGIENFKFEILEKVELIEDKKLLKNQLDELEVKYISNLETFQYGYNETKGGESNLGVTHSDYSRKKISNSVKKFYQEHGEEYFATHEYYYKETWSINYFTQEIHNFKSRRDAVNFFREKGYNLDTTDICKVLSGEISTTYDLIFGDSEKDCLERFNKCRNNNKLKHSSLLAPNYEKYLEYLISVCDCNGYIPSNKEIGEHYNRKPNTISGWNNKIREYLELDKSKNRLRLKDYSNPNINYFPQL